MREIMADMSDMFAMPRIGDSGNVYCPAVQLNLARPHLYDSSTYFFIFIIYLSYTYVFVSWGTYRSSFFWRYPHRRWRSAISIILHGHLLRSTRWLWSWSLPSSIFGSIRFVGQTRFSIFHWTSKAWRNSPSCSQRSNKGCRLGLSLRYHLLPRFPHYYRWRTDLHGCVWC